MINNIDRKRKYMYNCFEVDSNKHMKMIMQANRFHIYDKMD